MNSTWYASPLFAPACIAAAVAFAVALLIVLTQNWHGHFSIDSHDGIQKFHTHPTPRVGGIAVVVGVGVAYFFSPATVQPLLWPLLLAGIPAFAFGLLEDITKRVSVSTRLLATMFCGVLGWSITGFAITRANLPGLDWMLSFTVVSVAFTAFAVGGIANAINIIDGFNGLATGSVIIILGGFATISNSVGDVELTRICLLLACAVLGLLVVNWPFGKLFLGDGGAYFVGFCLAWIAVLLLARHPTVSAWAPLLVCGYPILEVVFSIVRRRRRGLSPGAPDRLHLHSIVKKRLVRHLLPESSNLVRNSVTGSIMWVAAVVPVVAASSLKTQSFWLVLALTVCGILYSVVYARLTQFRWCFSSTPMTTDASIRKRLV